MNTRDLIRAAVCGFTAAICLSMAGPVSATPVADLADALAKLRVEIETLTDDIQSRKRSHRERDRVHESQRAQLEAEIQREEIRVTQLEARKAVLTTRIDRARQAETTLEPIFSGAADALEKYIQQSIPFRRTERLAEIETLKARLASGTMTPALAMTRLWSLVEDEQRMSRDTGLFRDTLVLNGQRTLVDVVRFGTVGLYFRTGDNRVGRVVRSGNEWRTEFVDVPESQTAILRLFENFKKQIRVGFFELPNFLPEENTQ
ncbi:MAG: DUF3450 family protein [Myxococcota bacterium]|nr:DUF3450 family protein [Myxococcota bacterium]